MRLLNRPITSFLLSLFVLAGVCGGEGLTDSAASTTSPLASSSTDAAGTTSSSAGTMDFLGGVAGAEEIDSLLSTFANDINNDTSLFERDCSSASWSDCPDSLRIHWNIFHPIIGNKHCQSPSENSGASYSDAHKNIRAYCKSVIPRDGGYLAWSPRDDSGGNSILQYSGTTADGKSIELTGRFEPLEDEYLALTRPACEQGFGLLLWGHTCPSNSKGQFMGGHIEIDIPSTRSKESGNSTVYFSTTLDGPPTIRRSKRSDSQHLASPRTPEGHGPRYHPSNSTTCATTEPSADRISVIAAYDAFCAGQASLNV
ncbi:hypothetical protein B0A50_00802 [Salinomyces thailandicus]|uniref:Uncharacterized protein n=1 Tax=Salinomyces thailandicus TaxID=706561 RepID=A0A4V5N624_9PEZI|nr:hypothetical protein B0A50_00802 [Salinomyces thailandica]